MTEENGRMVHILVVGPALSGGGAENRFGNFCRAMTRIQRDVCVLTGECADFEPGGSLIKLGWRSEFSYPLIIMKLRGLLSRSSYDVVVGFGLFPSVVSWLARALIRRKPKFVVVEITRPWEALKQNAWYRRLLYRKLYRAVYLAADLLAANSSDALEECRRYFGMPGVRMRLLPNLIDRERIIKRAENVLPGKDAGGKKLIVAVSRLVRMKRFDTLIEAGARLSGDMSWQIVILGDGPELPNLKALADSLGVADRVVFKGWVDNPFPYVKNATVFVLSSEYEGFSNALLEAMFLGVPVVTSFCSKDIRDICLRGAALGFEPGDAVTLAQHLSRVLASAEERERLRAEALSYCTKHEARNGIKVYEQAILDALSGEKAEQGSGDT